MAYGVRLRWHLPEPLACRDGEVVNEGKGRDRSGLVASLYGP